MELPPFIDLLTAQPFQPFMIFLVDGRQFEIRHPELATIYNGGLGIWIGLPSGETEFIEGNAIVSLRTIGGGTVSGF